MKQRQYKILRSRLEEAQKVLAHDRRFDSPRNARLAASVDGDISQGEQTLRDLLISRAADIVAV